MTDKDLGSWADMAEAGLGPPEGAGVVHEGILKACPRFVLELVAEVRRLRAEASGSVVGRAELDLLVRTNKVFRQTIERQDAELARLRAENEKLREQVAIRDEAGEHVTAERNRLKVALREIAGGSEGFWMVRYAREALREP